MSKSICPVSVIIPFFNNEDTIIDSVASVLKQTLPPAELILIDDGSTDGSLDKLKAYLKYNETPHTQIIIERYEKNIGVYPARNRALELATQPFIAFQDGDDFWHLEKLKQQYLYFKEDPELFLVCSKVGCYEGKPKEAWHKLRNLPRVKRLTRRWVLWRNVMVTISVMIRRQPDFCFTTDKRRGSDMGLWLDIVLSGHKAAFIPQELAYTRKPLYGAGGLSGNIWKAERAQQKNLIDLKKKGYVSGIELSLLRSWSYMKYLRRLVVVQLRVSAAKRQKQKKSRESAHFFELMRGKFHRAHYSDAPE